MATLDRHRCHDPRCRRPFAVVFRTASNEPGWLNLACPHCGTMHLVIGPAGVPREFEGAYVLPLPSGGAALTA